jgi:putative flippase GtrA
MTPTEKATITFPCVSSGTRRDRTQPQEAGRMALRLQHGQATLETGWAHPRRDRKTSSAGACPGTACHPFNHQPNNGRTLPLTGNNQGSTSQTLFMMQVRLALTLTGQRQLPKKDANADICANALIGRVFKMPVKIGYFSIISGIGWIVDFLIFGTIIKLGLTAGHANLISASVAVAFVFLTSRRWIFRLHVGSLRSVIAKYILWNIFAIGLASWGVGAAHRLFAPGAPDILEFARSHFLQPPITAQTLAAIAAKLFVTPFTMYSNFVAFGFILEGRVRFY